MTQFALNFDHTKPITDTAMMAQLSGGTNLSWTVPGNSKQIFRADFRASYTAEIWIALNQAAVLPSSGVATTVSGQEFIPLREPKYVKGGDTINFISTGTPQVGVSLLLVQNIAS